MPERHLPNRRVVIYYNQLSGRARRLAGRYQLFFENAVADVTLLPSSASSVRDQTQLIQVCEGAHECVVIGGDGSINIVVNALIQANLQAQVAMTVIPVGTGNDFARDHGLKRWNWRMNANITTLTEAVCHVQSEGLSRYFVNHVGTGLSVDLMRLQQHWLKQSAGRLSYLIALARYLFGSMTSRSRIRRGKYWDDGQFVALGRYIGGGFLVHPHADRTDAMLARIRVPKMPRWRQTKALLNVLKGRIETTAAIEFERGKQFQIGDSEHALELDGDIYFHGPATVTVSSTTILVSVPDLKKTKGENS
ncbi:diacylglycerol/lipid kinase family protein [Pseudidiomarina andamanensis]|uniref:DAGKc domain-containing protein n=1 Tax=Pseudidiomarina andamanensis TaxID=1940690 RepID=A0AA92ETC7_9GAMM|nr:diacylglycerol kinase family protein [Pseudidiomarina andamanensis]MDS0218435.1 hypothetical protein [Pseudidiomarina andamanensis]QGT95316.1 hypothetical protein D3795_03590 [Pseudidiomarina andamanensis]